MIHKLPFYQNITFKPEQHYKSDKEFNMYSGFQATEVKEVDIELIQPILNHILHCWANTNYDLFDYILQWFRQAWLYPHIKTQIVLLLYGLEGTGKGILIDNLIIPYVYGTKTACVSHGLTPIVQRFNSICMNKLFICANEVSSEGHFHSSFEKLKALITDPTMPIEKKGIDMFEDYPNYINFIFTTNNFDSVKLGKSDRRYVCLETSDRYKGNFDYFDELTSSINQEVANHFYTYIIRLEKTRNIKKIPMTDLKLDMLKNTENSIDRFLREVKEWISCKVEIKSMIKHHPHGTNICATEVEGYSRKNFVENLNEENEIQCSTLFGLYLSFCMKENDTKESMNKFGKVAKQHGILRIRKGVVKTCYYKF